MLDDLAKKITDLGLLFYNDTEIVDDRLIVTGKKAYAHLSAYRRSRTCRQYDR